MMLVSPATKKRQIDRLIAAFDDVLTDLFEPRLTMTRPSPSGSTPAEAEAFLAAHPEIEAFDIVLHDANGIGRGKIIRRHELVSLYQQRAATCRSRSSASTSAARMCTRPA